MIERAVVLTSGNVLDLDALPDLDAPTAPPPSPPWPVNEPSRALEAPLTIEELERSYVEQALAATGWVIEGERGAARRLGLHPNTLRSRLKRWGISRPANDVASA